MLLFEKATTHQEALLWRAIGERGLITVDHLNGRAAVFGRTYGLIYPDSFFEKTQTLPETTKRVRFFFRGNMERGARTRPSLLAGWGDKKDAVVEHSDWARDHTNRGSFDKDYFERLASAEFGLCPHHLKWVGDATTMWTYRFIDCCLVGTIPVLFKRTPLGRDFIDGFHYVWDDDGSFAYDRDKALGNRALAETRFSLP